MTSENTTFDSEEIVTVKDLCQIARTDIVNTKKKSLIHGLVCHSVSLAINTKENRKLLMQDTKKISEILKTSEFKKEFVSQLSL